MSAPACKVCRHAASAHPKAGRLRGMCGVVLDSGQPCPCACYVGHAEKRPKTKPNDPAKRELFLAALERHGSVRYACKVAGIDRSTAYDWARRDAAFEAAWKERFTRAVEKAEESLYTRAFRGVKSPIIARTKNGPQVVGEEIRFSDKAAELWLKANAPDKYRERVDAHVRGSITFVSSYAGEPPPRPEGAPPPPVPPKKGGAA